MNNLEQKVPARDLMLKRMTEDFLTELGVPVNFLGYDYLTTAVCLVIDNPNIKSRVCKELYPRIAKIYGTRSTRVERAIHHSIDFIFSKPDGAVHDLFGNTINANSGKVTNSEFVFRIAQLIQRKWEDTNAT